MIRTGALRTVATVAQRVVPQHIEVREGRLPQSQSPFVPKLEFFNSVTANGQQIPTYRVLDGSGTLLEEATLPEIDEASARKIYEHMQLLPAMDTILYNVQRQGKISFYYGEEATVVGAAAALEPHDEVLGQYRESGVLLWRGFGIDNIMAQCLGNEEDMSTKGRQMPVHFASRKHHFHSISSPLATQIPQAAGVGYALRRTPQRSNSIAVCFMGEGAASEGDFHAGLQMASTIPSPTMFIVRNNGFAISTPSTEQYHGDGIASRGPGYGIDTIPLREARRRCLEQSRAVLVEAMTYRLFVSHVYIPALVHHSTSDDSFAYRARSEVEDRKRIDNPIVRLRRFMEQRGWWSAEEEDALKAELFNDVYAGQEPWTIQEQRRELAGLLRKYGEAWDPWKKELARFKNNGRDLMDAK
ncbi:thiamine diphosphate-binding protein [Schizophyllum amplum]|uniref:2-oxoisovalerate dehydrogenase subunit alpha n=1 Tax=Schizophyllum amplum TaxID=97359 RepID=A0A550CH58_9AGAR|nr:thiamine diphosphate-binding protein [Auriculariopsis ampla]